MKRSIILGYKENHFFLAEDDNELFTIDESNLKFDSLKFYEGIYKNKSADIDLRLDGSLENSKQGNYIYRWIDEIVTEIKEKLKVPLDEETIDETKKKIIRLFDLSVCAGNGFYLDNNISFESYSTEILDADYAVRISGRSMEPTVPDGSIALVSNIEEYNNNDIVIVVYEGDAMCKRYKEERDGAYLVSDNSEGEFKTIEPDNFDACTFQGKVIAYNVDNKTVRI